MKFVTTSKTCRFGVEGCDNSSVMDFLADQTYVVPDFITHGIACEMRELSGHVRISGTGHYIRPYCGQDLRGKRLLAWRGCGIGDQLMWAGLLVAIQHRFPTCQIVNLCAGNIAHHLWAGADLPFQTATYPMPREEWDACDYHLIGDALCEADREPDQPDVWTGMFRRAGIENMLPDALSPAPSSPPHHSTIPPFHHSTPFTPAPLTPLRQVDRLFAHEWLASHSPAGSAGFQPASSPPSPSSPPFEVRSSTFDVRRSHLVWQLSASSPIRTYSPWATADALALLVATFASTHDIIVLGTRRDREEFATALQTPGIIIADELELRQGMALVAAAAALIAPDSCMGHLAQAENTPTISLWGSFLPQDRVGYYSVHHPLVGDPAACDRAPCRAHEPGKPQGCPRCGEDPRACRYCAVLATITPAAIVAKLQEIL